MITNHKRCGVDMDGNMEEEDKSMMRVLKRCRIDMDDGEYKSMMRNFKRFRIDMDGDVEESELIDLKRLRIDMEEDRLSHLPRELIDCIVKHLPVHDAARTSILSKTWRYIWAMHPHLLFCHLDMSSLENIDRVSRVINTVFSLHIGPILDFHLNVHPKLYGNHLLWIKHVSNNGVRNLKLINVGKNAAEMPSHLFDCSKLTELIIRAWILNPPYEFGGFQNLTKVVLCKISITADMYFGPKLEILRLIRCTGIEHLRQQLMDSKNLKQLVICVSKKIGRLWFEHTKNLDKIASAWLDSSLGINLNKLLGNLSNISRLHLDVSKFLEPHRGISNWLTTTMVYLTDLSLHRLDCNDLCQISYVMCLITSSPNLRYLLITMTYDVETRNPMELTVEQYIRMLCSTKMDRLEAVTVGRLLVGSRAKLHFLKLLLASSPSLKRMSIIQDPKYNDPEQELRITGELRQFNKASSAAQIIWTSPVI